MTRTETCPHRLRRAVLLVLAFSLFGACKHDAAASCGGATLQFDALGARGKTAKRPAKPARGFQQPDVPLGLNLGSVNYFASALPFTDVMKMADPFLSTNAVQLEGEKTVWDTEVAAKIPRDALGYPLEIPFSVPGVRAPQILRASVVSPAYGGRYTLLYDGTGEIEFPASPVTVISRAPGRIELDVQAVEGRPVFVAITRSSRGNHVRNIRLLLPGHAESSAKQMFHPTFLARLRGVSTLRYMDWGRTNGSPLEHWSDRATPGMSQGTDRGVSLEIMVELANQVGADAWFCVPHKADDAYIEQMAKLIKARLDPKRRVYIEYSNELWNSIFEQVAWTAKKGCAAGLNKLGDYAGSCDDGGSRYWAGIKWQARRSGQIFRTFDRVFGSDAQRVVHVLAGQAQNQHLNEKLIESFADPAINTARSQADVLAIAPYIGGSVASGVAEQGQKDSVNALQILDHLEKDIVPAVQQTTAANKKLADQHGLGLVAYEGGQHLVAYGEAAADERFVQKLIEANRLPRMRAVYRQMLDAWYQASGNGLIVLFNFAEAPTKFGSWGLLEKQEQRVETAPKYQAFLERLQALNYVAAEKALKAAGTKRTGNPRAPNTTTAPGPNPPPGAAPTPTPSSPTPGDKGTGQ